MSHMMKLWERVVEARLRQEVVVGDQQFGFMPWRSTTDAIFGVEDDDREVEGRSERAALCVH